MLWKKISRAFLVLFILAIFMLIALRVMQAKLKRDREVVAVETLTAVHEAEMKYKSSHGNFGTLPELIDDGLVHQSIGSRATSLYIYTLENSATTFCANATREPAGKAYRDFNLDQTGVVRFVEATRESKIPCGTGTPINESK